MWAGFAAAEYREATLGKVESQRSFNYIDTMAYLVTARKWRPMVFEEIIGQKHIATTLRNAIATNRLSHAYIFSGPRGVGKTTTARILAKAINCLHPRDSNPDNECEICREITEGRSLNVFEIDGASNRGVEEIRNLREAVRYGPARGKYKVYIIDEVHMLTKEAFNALLKTLEEPPPYVVFMFATTEIHKVPLTILSRCQRFDFRLISIEEITERLRHIASAEGVEIEDDALFLVARRGDGSMRDAQSIFDQVVSYCPGKIKAADILSMLNIVDDALYFRVTDIIKRRDVKEGLLLIDEVLREGFDLREFLIGLTEHLRNMLVMLSTGSPALIDASELYRKRYQQEAGSISENDLLRLISIAGETDGAMRWSQQPRLKLEIGLMKMIKLNSSVELSKLLDQLDAIKKKANGEPHDAATRRTADASPGEAHDAPIRGSVKASMPMLREDQIVPPASAAPPGGFSFSRELSSQTVMSAAAALRQSTATGPWTVLSNDEAAGKWSLLITEARKERIAVGTMLSETRLMDVRENRIRIGCPDDFHLDALQRNRQYIQDLAQKVYGAKVQLEGIVAAHASQPATGRVREPEDSSHEALARHPVIQALIREFGAKEVE